MKLFQLNNYLKKIWLSFTDNGERPSINKKIEDISSDSRFCYEFASSKIKNKDIILDYGCGGGYGTEYLSRFTKNKTIGYDIDNNTIKNNQSFFQNNKSLSFVSSQENLKKYQGKVNIIVCSQTIEHVKLTKQAELIKFLKKYLHPKGILIISTVNKNITSPGLKKPVFPFHEYEYYPEDLLNKLKEHFSTVKILSQIKKESNSERKKNKNSKTNFRVKLLITLSQFEFIRFLARHTPLFVKKIIWGIPKDNHSDNINEYMLSDKKTDFADSYILIAICRL